MSRHPLTSDQSSTWSDNLVTPVLGRSTKTWSDALAAITSVARFAATLAHRAIQALRRSRLQVRAGSWPRAEVLPVGELPEAAAADRLRAAGVRRRGPYEPRSLPPRPRDPRADLRDQPGAPAASRGALRCGGEGGRDAHRPDRHRLCEPSARQHARGLARCRAQRRSGCFGRGRPAARKRGGNR